MPLHWYFTSALPRALLGALPLAVLGVALERRLRSKLACVLMYITAYSLLPHKEVRHPCESNGNTWITNATAVCHWGLHLLKMSSVYSHACIKS